MTLNDWITEADLSGCFCRIGLRTNTISKQVDWEIGGLNYNQTTYITVYWPMQGRTPRVLKLHMNDLGKLEWSVTEKDGTGHATQS